MYTLSLRSFILFNYQKYAIPEEERIPNTTSLDDSKLHRRNEMQVKVKYNGSRTTELH